MDESRTGSDSRNRGGRDRDPGREPRNDGNKYDDPPNSRLFIVCGKNITEDQFKESFGTFGTIEEVWVLKDRTTQEPKGVTYIKPKLKMAVKFLYVLVIVTYSCS